MDKATESIQDDALHVVYMCNLLIAQSNTWTKPLTVQDYMVFKKNPLKNRKILL